jgi:hypothetical protein
MLDSAIVDALVDRLTDPANSESAATFPVNRVATEYPGLYSWWADDETLSILSTLFGVRMPSLIYAGQAGATSTRSRKIPSTTLRSRICTNHLGGNVRASTFRKTMTAVLLEHLALQLVGPHRLDKASNDAVSKWVREHLRIVTGPHIDREQLANVEQAVLERIDPPLNLMGMPSTPIRATLIALRHRLGCSPRHTVTRSGPGERRASPGRSTGRRPGGSRSRRRREHPHRRSGRERPTGRSRAPSRGPAR